MLFTCFGKHERTAHSSVDHTVRSDAQFPTPRLRCCVCAHHESVAFPEVFASGQTTQAPHEGRSFFVPARSSICVHSFGEIDGVGSRCGCIQYFSRCLVQWAYTMHVTGVRIVRKCHMETRKLTWQKYYGPVTSTSSSAMPFEVIVSLHSVSLKRASQDKDNTII